MTTRGFRLDQDNRLNNFAIEPEVYVDSSVQAGWTKYAKKMNGRFAMIGFASLLIMEVVTGHGVIGWLNSL
ncbi:high light inducible protein [Synechocystis sp. PCC 7338]|uniref:high light inducible protein n=1 Tax=Synechocystis sp. PCC 7338 TaxID=2732530 RepID=UPI001BAFDAB1|nr:high light inducible protein [Synechocystis sp. PCC 7338]QUS59539.1 high light inducible protein [Synechocystis sp. PCC 7338]